MFDDRDAPGRRARTCDGFGDAFAGRGAGPQRGDRGVRPAAAQPRAGDAATCRTRGPQLARLLPGARARPRAIVAPVRRDAGRAVREPRHDVRRARRRRDAVLQAVDPRRARRRSTRRSRDLPQPAAVPGQHDGLFRELRPGVRALRDRRADARRRARDRHAGAQARRRPFNRRLEPAFAGARALRRPTRSSPLGVARPDRRPSQIAQPDARASSRRRRRSATTSRCGSATWRACSREGDTNGTWQRFIIVAAPQGPNNEGGPSSAPANGPNQRQLPAHQPVPEHRLAGPAARVRGGQRDATRRAARSIGNVPGNQGTLHDRHDAEHARSEPLSRDASQDATAAPAPQRREPVHGRRWSCSSCSSSPRSSASPSTSRSRTASASRRCSSRRTRSGRTRRCGSPASTSARSRASSGQAGTDTAIVTMEIDDKGLPLHKDATAKIRPRIFLEGNFFVDLQPGTPSTPTLDDGDTIPVTQTGDAGPARPGAHRAAAATRAPDLQELVAGYGRRPHVQADARRDDTDAGPVGPRPERRRSR